MRPVFLLAFVALFPVFDTPGFGQTLPTPPQATVDTTMPPITGNTYGVNAGGNLQAAINQAAANNPNLNHLIILQAGASFPGPFTLPPRPGGTGWIILQSSAIGGLPLEGRRVKPSDSSNMPKIVVGGGSGGAIQTASGTHHFRFVGVEVKPVAGAVVYDLVEVGAGETTEAPLPHDIIFDRCYLHGNSTRGMRRGLAMNAARVAVIDSYLSAFWEVGADSQAIAGWNGLGPFKIVNNYLEGAGQNVMFGGADPAISGLVPSDIEIRQNYFVKPLRGKTSEPGSAETSGSLKNLLVLKNARRVLIQGNIFEQDGGDAQSGFAILFTAGNQDGTAPWSVVEDVTFQRNIVRHTGWGMNILGEDDIHPSQQTQRLLIKDNLIEDVLRGNGGGDGRIFQIVTPNRPTVDLTIDHNTALLAGGGSVFIIAGDTTPAAQNFIFQNTLVTHGDYGLMGKSTGEGLATLHHYFPGYTFQKNVIVGGGHASVYPANNFFPSSLDAVGFTGWAEDDFRLSASSPYKNAATDHKDIGADMSSLALATAGVVQGTPDQTPPTVSITAPVEGATVFGTSVTVSAAASDNVGVVGVQFMLDGTTLAPEVMTPPFSISWNTTTDANGPHTLTAVARDAAGNTTTSRGIVVTVFNVPGGGGSSDKTGCFFAVSTCGPDRSRILRILRAFRDRTLIPHPLGHKLVELYYRHSPPLANYIKDKEGLKGLVRFCLRPLVFILERIGVEKKSE